MRAALGEFTSPASGAFSRASRGAVRCALVLRSQPPGLDALAGALAPGRLGAPLAARTGGARSLAGAASWHALLAVRVRGVLLGVVQAPSLVLVFGPPALPGISQGLPDLARAVPRGRREWISPLLRTLDIADIQLYCAFGFEHSTVRAGQDLAT